MEEHTKSHMTHKSPYLKLLYMAIISFIAMYLLMYAMVDKLSNVIPNINQFYMAGLMTSPMLIIELLIMGSMYKNKKLNTIIMIASMAALVICFLFIRNQTFVSEKQFLKSMIPHHAAAILMVEKTQLTDPEIMKLANDIITSQQKEIDFMKSRLEQMDNK